MTITTSDAQQAHAARLAHIRETLAALQALADRDFGHRAGDVHWGHAGNLARVDQLLDEALGFVTGR